MTFTRRVLVTSVTTVMALGAVVGVAMPAFGQAVNDLPNPYTTHQGHFTLPDGRTWGSTSAVEGVAVDANGNIFGAEVGPRQLARYTR